MPRRLLPLAFACLLLSAPTALAGSERSPEITDDQDMPYPSLDLLAAWFEYHEDGVRFTIKITALPEGHRDDIYWVGFRAGGEDVFAAAGFDRSGRLLSYQGPPNGRIWTLGGFERVANGGVIHLEARHGTPGYVSGVVPWGTVYGLQPGVMLLDLVMGAARYHRDGGGWEGGLDHTRSTATFLVKEDRAPLRTILGWSVGLAIALAGTSVGVATYRRAGKLPAPAHATPGSPSSGPPPAREDTPGAGVPRGTPLPPLALRLDPRR